jgi:hypothetical protein
VIVRIGILLHILHLCTRLPVFTASLPSWTLFERAKGLSDADARLEALRRVASGVARSRSSIWSVNVSWVASFSHNTRRDRALRASSHTGNRRLNCVGFDFDSKYRLFVVQKTKLSVSVPVGKFSRRVVTVSINLNHQNCGK